MYNFKKIETKWQKYWEDNHCFKAVTGAEQEKYYILVEFPYPSGVGLHLGHPRSYTALDSLARKRRLQGYNVLFPFGWDAFGLPAENYAVKNKIHPKEAVKENVKVFKKQCQNLGLSFDWDREIATTDPGYVKWTQWQFLKFYEHNMAYKDKITINWCTSCKIGLANEEVENNKCERCGGKIVKKEKAQWMLKMRSYADKLLDGLEETKFIDRVKTAQINWIGKSEGAEIEFTIINGGNKLKVYTTRPDTIYGVTYMAVSPEHPLLSDLKAMIDNYIEVEAYIKKSAEKSDFERLELNKEKTGLRLEGIQAINPLSNEKIDIYVADYVLMNYGTGAVMGVPAHDERDYVFAKKYNIPIVEVIKGGEASLYAYTGEGEMINSGILNGIDNQAEAVEKITNYLTENNIGIRAVNYRLQDFIFSRQRFWGEPIPMIYCDKCDWVPVPEKDLPVLLPDIAMYEPTDDGESPLASIPEWYTVACPKCGKGAKRETDTMPNWAGSSWYWLRYMDPHNEKEFASMEALKYWGKVDWYNGGMEHATRHLLYARFWHRFLYDIGLVPTKEPFEIRTSHGMVLGEDGGKLSKSKGTGINPDELVKQYGADTLRTYEMFMGDYETDTAWSTNGLKGCKRFLDRVWKIQEKLIEEEVYSKNLESVIHKTIKKVDHDIETMKYNTAISALMVLLNEYEKQDNITKGDLRLFVTLLYPFAPHIAEEVNDVNKLGETLCISSWPIYDKLKTVDDTYEMIVQVNGKLRAKINIDTNSNEDLMQKLALENNNVKRHIDNKDIIKVITVPNKLVNIVIK